MRIKQRYAFIFILIVILVLLRCLWNRKRSLQQSSSSASVDLDIIAAPPAAEVIAPHYIEIEAKFDEGLDDEAVEEAEKKVDGLRVLPREVREDRKCTMRTCFDMDRCKHDKLKVFIYPDPTTNASLFVKPSEIYANVLRAIRDSEYYTNRPEDACLFVLSIDTLDRDKLSANYIKNLPGHIASLPPHLWNNGTNHLIFNMYYGTFPSYSARDIGFDVGNGFWAWASTDVSFYRPHFDIAFPLFHKELPASSAAAIPEQQEAEAAASKPYLLSFKGKRYVYGIGSETRNALHHLHNDRDVIMLLTCKHGKDWQQMQDERCATDNAMYDRWDYDALMSNSTFCLVPRGRRLGSFRFLEALRVGCIPVVLADDWLLPFSQIIDWSKAAVIVHERALFLVPEMLREVPESRVREMSALCRRLYNTYFSSVENIVKTTFMILEQRIQAIRRDRGELFPAKQQTEQQLIAELLRNNLLVSSDESSSPFVPFTMVLQLSADALGLPGIAQQMQAFMKLGLIELIVLCQSAAQCKRAAPLVNRQPHLNSLFVQPTVTTDAIVFASDMADVHVDSLRTALGTWRLNQWRLIGYHGTQFVSYTTAADQFTQEQATYMLDLSFVIFHTFYLEEYRSWSVQQRVTSPGCAAIGLNVMVANYTNQPLVLLPGSSMSSGSENALLRCSPHSVSLRVSSLPAAVQLDLKSMNSDPDIMTD